MKGFSEVSVMEMEMIDGGYDGFDAIVTVATGIVGGAIAAGPVGAVAGGILGACAAVSLGAAQHAYNQITSGTTPPQAKSTTIKFTN